MYLANILILKLQWLCSLFIYASRKEIDHPVDILKLLILTDTFIAIFGRQNILDIISK